MLRLGYCCHTPFPATATHTQQVFWTLYEVARLGARVTLSIPWMAAPPPGRPAGETIGAWYGAPDGTMPDSFTIASTGARRSGGWVEELRFDLGAAARMRDLPLDLVWTRDYVAAAVCVRAGLPTVFETYRLDLATRARFALWRRAVLDRPALRGLILHSDLAARAFVAAGVPAERCLVAHNGFAPHLMEPRLDPGDARAALDLPGDRPLVVYTGHTGRGKGADVLMAMAAAMPEVRFLLVGASEGGQAGGAGGAGRAGKAGGDRNGLPLAAPVSGASNVLTRRHVPVAQVAAYLYAADCLIVPPTAAPLRRFRRTVLPMKLFPYLAAGRPILAPRLPDVEEVLTDGVTARLVKPDEVEGACAALRELLGDAPLRRRMSAAAVATSGSYTWSRRAERIVTFLRERCVHSASRPTTTEAGRRRSAPIA